MRLQDVLALSGGRRLHEREPFQNTTGVDRFVDQQALGTAASEPDSYYFNAAPRMIERERGNGPLFLFAYLAQNHFPGTIACGPT